MKLYEPVTPWATYSPWNEDKEFQEIHAAIEGYTLVDKYRCWELWKLVEQSAKLSEGHLLEVGVWRGGSGALIAKQADRSWIKEYNVFLCDTFTGVIKVGPEDSNYKEGEHSDTSIETVLKLITKLRLSKAIVMPGIFPDERGEDIENLNFRFVHIDVDTYQSAKDVAHWVWPRLVKGGIIVYDDYGFEQCSGVTKYVNEQDAFQDRLFIHNLNGHAIMIKL